MSAKIDLQGTQAEKLKHIWLDQAKKFSAHASDLRDFIQSAHKWSDIWHTTVWGRPDALPQKDLYQPPATNRPPVSRRCARAERQRFGKKMTARFPGTAGHRQR